MPNGNPLLVKIHVDASGNFTYTPAVLHAAPGSTVVWWCDVGNFVCSFQGKTPFDRVEHHGHKSAEPLVETALTIPTGVTLGTYHYSVAVAVENQGCKVYVNGGCPELVIP